MSLVNKSSTNLGEELVGDNNNGPLHNSLRLHMAKYYAAVAQREHLLFKQEDGQNIMPTGPAAPVLCGTDNITGVSE